MPDLNKLLLTIVCTCTAIAASATVVLTGVLKNAAPGEKIELLVPHFYVDNGSDTYRALIDGQQQFTIIAEVPEPQVAFLVHGEDQLAVFLEPNDTLLVKSDLFQFPLGVAFSGRAGANNRLLRDYFQQYHQLDFNEFNNVRFKIGRWWFGVESAVNETMLTLEPLAFKADQLKRKTDALALIDAFNQSNPGALTPAFQTWIEAEVLYSWALHLLLYGQVYKNRYQIEPDFFDFLFDAPVNSDAVGSDAYRQFLMVLMARQQARKEDPERYFVGQCEQAAQLLSGKSQAFFQSEIIRMAMSSERTREVLPAYLQFLQTNKHTAYDAKITAIYEKTIAVAAGSPVPDFDAKDINGLSVSTNSLRGQVVYLNFWATWCSACVKKMDIFNAYEPELNAAGIKIVNISLDANEASWRAMLADRQFIGTQILSGTSPVPALSTIFNVEAVPQYFIINKNGTFADKPYSNQPEDIKNRLLRLAE